MVYLLDASVLITAHNSYYALERVPEFWAWLVHHGAAGAVKLPSEIYAEVEDGNDALAEWMREAATKEALLLGEQADAEMVQQVLARYGDNLSEEDLIEIGNDPFLIAAGLAHLEGCSVVTAEVSKPARTGARRHIPNVCQDCDVRWLTPIQFLAALDFSTSWNA